MRERRSPRVPSRSLPCCRASIAEQLARRPDRALGLPERRAAVVAERIERADVGERHDSSRRRPVRATRSSSDENGAAATRGDPVVRAVVAEPAPTGRACSSIDASSQPHFGQSEIGWPALGSPRAWRRWQALGRPDAGCNRLPHLLPQAAHVAQPEPNRAVALRRCSPSPRPARRSAGNGRRGAARPLRASTGGRTPSAGC